MGEPSGYILNSPSSVAYPRG